MNLLEVKVGHVPQCAIARNATDKISPNSITVYTISITPSGIKVNTQIIILTNERTNK